LARVLAENRSLKETLDAAITVVEMANLEIERRGKERGADVY
jgi:hypothetical protein